MDGVERIFHPILGFKYHKWNEYVLNNWFFLSKTTEKHTRQKLFQC